MSWLSVLVAMSLPSVAWAGPIPHPDGPLPRFVTPEADGRFAGTLRAADLSASQQARLARLGVELRREGQRFAHVGDVWAVDGSLEALRAARDAGFEVEIARRLDLHPSPLIQTGAEVQAFDLWAAGPTPADGATGHGQKILDIDSGIDIFHPQYFRADAGHHLWVDTDGNGRLDPGIDGIDLDGDGSIAASEVLHLAQARAYDFDWKTYSWDYLYDSGALDPARDWLFIDTNLDGTRNRSKADGWLERDPAYGEPLFVPDDADRSGTIEAGEKVLQLGTSIIRAVRTPLHTYERGVDLIDYVVTADIASHGTGVSGILAGGQLPRQRATVGLAPDAELYIAQSTSSDAALAATLRWAEDESVDVVIHEYAPWTGFALDGSSAVEAMVDAQQAGSMVHICPAGNLADAGKHAVAAVDAGTVRFDFEVPQAQFQPGLPWQFLWLELHADAGSADLDGCQLTDPDGVPFDFDLKEWGTYAGDHILWSSQTRTGTDRPWATLVLESTQALLPGTWSLQCTSPDADGPAWHVFLNDYYSGWGRGITVHDEVIDNTMGVPSTSADCLSVGAYAGRKGDLDVTVGELRKWSSRGPTVDGRRGIDLLAPDDPFSSVPSYAFDPWLAPYGPFGGTSGASPHIAALSALMTELDPSLSGLDVRDLLMDQAEPYAGDPSHVGSGKVRGYAGFFGSEPSEAPAMRPELLVEVTTTDDCAVGLDLPADVQAEIDVGYDGTIDHPWATEHDLAALLDAGPTELRVEFAVGGWVVGGGTATVDLSCTPAPTPTDPTGTEPTEPTDTEPTDTDTPGDDDPSTGGSDDDAQAKGCGCEAASGTGAGAWLALLALVAHRRRRR